ncbi:hypothetical protein Tco_0698689 [Tanacetum coccineum]
MLVMVAPVMWYDGTRSNSMVVPLGLTVVIVMVPGGQRWMVVVAIVDLRFTMSVPGDGLCGGDRSGDCSQRLHWLWW